MQRLERDDAGGFESGFELFADIQEDRVVAGVWAIALALARRNGSHRLEGLYGDKGTGTMSALMHFRTGNHALSTHDEAGRSEAPHFSKLSSSPGRVFMPDSHVSILGALMEDVGIHILTPAGLGVVEEVVRPAPSTPDAMAA